MPSDSDTQAADRMLLRQIIAEARQCGAPNVATLFESDSSRSGGNEARRLEKARRRLSPFVYVMQ